MRFQHVLIVALLPFIAAPAMAGMVDYQDINREVSVLFGGGGGSLENPGPVRPDFNNTVRHGHHYCMVRVNGGTLEYFAYDLDNQLFDHMRIDKAN